MVQINRPVTLPEVSNTLHDLQSILEDVSRDLVELGNPARAQVCAEWAAKASRVARGVDAMKEQPSGTIVNISANADLTAIVRKEVQRVLRELAR